MNDNIFIPIKIIFALLTKHKDSLDKQNFQDFQIGQEIYYNQLVHT